MATGKWTIQFAEMAAKVYERWDIARFGMGFSHPFLRKIDDHGALQGEIHGTWFSSGIDERKRNLAAKLMNDFSVAVQHEGLVSSTTYVMGPLKPLSLISAREEDFRPAEPLYLSPVFTGPKAEVNEIWDSIKRTFPEINDRHQPYYRYATLSGPTSNCQKVLREAMEKAHIIPCPSSLHLAQTAWDDVPTPTVSHYHIKGLE